MNVRPLLVLLADGRFHSGEELGSQLGVSRAAVWKQIRLLRELDVDVQAVRGRGYRMPDRVDLLDARRMLSLMEHGSSLFANDFTVHFSTDSTNAEAMRRIRGGAGRCLIMAEHQSGGRGRRGRAWVSPLGHNIYLSMVWPFERGVTALEGLSLVCGLAVAEAARRYSRRDDITLKWPNDVLLNGRKLAGILLEVQGDINGPCHMVIGVGVNTLLPADAASRVDQPFSVLSGAGSSPVDRNRFAALLVDALVVGLRRFSASGFQVFREDWVRHDHYLGSHVCVGAGSDGSLTGIVAGVDDSGRLLLELPDGRLQALAGGELFPSVRPVAQAKAETDDC